MPTPAHVIRSIFTLGLAQVLSSVGGAALAVLLPRYLGDVNLGKFAFALALTSLVGLAADLGTATYLAKEIARAPARAAALTANALAMRVPLSLLAGLLAVAVVNLAGYDLLTRQVVYVLCLGIVASAMGNVVLGSLQGLQAMKALAAYSVATRLGFAGLAGAVLLGGAGPAEVAVAWVASLALGLAVGLQALLGRVRLSPWTDWGAWRSILLGGLPFFVWQAALLVYGQIDAVLLSLLTHDAVVGWYTAAYRVVMIPAFVPTIIVTVLFPALSAAAGDRPAFHALARRAVQAVLLLSLPMALGIMLLPDKLIGLLGYPERFTHSIVPIVLLAAHIPLVGVDMALGTALNTLDRQRQWALAGVAAAVLNPLLNLVTIPYAQATYGNGAIGAAAITTLTEVFMLAAGLRLLPAGVLGRATLVDAARCVAAGLAMAGVVWLARDLPLAIPVLLGALVYGGACLALGAVSRSDLEQVWLHLAMKSGPLSTVDRRQGTSGR
ncbi:MAG: flippase [Chloroflexi bacterium]|nr:flippase [Chloroflexota bacterium]